MFLNRKAHLCRLNLHTPVEKHRRSTTAPAFFASICKPVQQNCIFQTLETPPCIRPLDIQGNFLGGPFAILTSLQEPHRVKIWCCTIWR
jgi:hypothetical protein